MPRGYAVAARNIGLATASGDYDLLSLTAAAEKPIRLTLLIIGNQSEIGDAQEEMLDFTIVRGNTTVGTGGSAVTPRGLDPDQAAAAFTARVADTAIASAGTEHLLFADTMNVRAGVPYILPEAVMPKTRNGTGLLVVRLNVAVADAATISLTAIVEEGN